MQNNIKFEAIVCGFSTSWQHSLVVIIIIHIFEFNCMSLRYVSIVGIAWHDGEEVSASGWGSGGPRFQSHPRLTFQSRSRYHLNQKGSRVRIDLQTVEYLWGIKYGVLYFIVLPTTYFQNLKIILVFKNRNVSRRIWHRISCSSRTLGDCHRCFCKS